MSCRIPKAERRFTVFNDMFTTFVLISYAPECMRQKNNIYLIPIYNSIRNKYVKQVYEAFLSS